MLCFTHRRSRIPQSSKGRKAGMQDWPNVVKPDVALNG